MRSSERPTGAVWRLLEAWAKQEQENDRLGRRVTQAEMAGLFRVSDSLLSAWKRCTSRMQMDDQIRIVKVTGISQEALALALAEDEPRIARANAARPKDAKEAGEVRELRAAANKVPESGPAEQPDTIDFSKAARRTNLAPRNVGDEGPRPDEEGPEHGA